MEIFLTLLSGISWTIVYIELIRNGLKYKTYLMPLFALSLNISWELLYSINDLIIVPSTNNIQAIVNLVWACLDLIIVYTYFKYGRKYFTEESEKYFLPFSILIFITGLALQLAFYYSFTPLAAAQYSAFMQNVAMSILFLIMLFNRRDTTGQTILMGVAKWIGTLAPALLMGLIQSFNPYIIICGVICSIFDLLYIYFLNKKSIKRR
ncbi:hypothetical protein EFE32_12370 [Lactococcus lactis subsp. lactis]|uniref:transmembrane-type terpene cyclase n=1 Tax=Lactococcus lactis TaxID=1358 RepID=UPI00223AA07D|nr:hypothetical protein [Lactococcus lactis]MCT0017569.1 hypothetical protein [Lactococcus lactis subsp. lactis]